MSARTDLSLSEEVLLLALRDREGTVKAGSFYTYALGAAILADLLLSGRIRTAERKNLVTLVDSRPLGDPLLDEALARIASAGRRASLRAWLSRFARIRRLKDRLAQQLCRRGILRADEDKVLLLFTRKIYPEIDPGPERELIDRLRRAVRSADDGVDARTAVLIALARHAEILRPVFSKEEWKQRKPRIEKIARGEAIGKATAEAIQAAQAAVIVAATLPAVLAGGR